jgi:hypothetical protein
VTDTELLIGTWMMTGEEVRTAEFNADGTLTYTIDIGERTLAMKMTWRIEGGMMLIDQPSGPGEERSVYQLVDNDTLVMEHGGESFIYSRYNELR